MLILLLTLCLAVGGITAIYLDRPLLIAVVTVVPLGAAFVLRRIDVTFAALLVFGAWAIVFGPGGILLTPYKFVTLSFIAIALWRLSRGHADRPPPFWLTGSISLMLIMFTISEINSEMPRFTQLTNLFSVGVVAYMVWQVINTIEAARSLSWVIGMGQLWMLLWVWRELPWSSLMSNHSARALGLAGQPNASGALGLTWFFLALPLAFDRGAARWQRLIAAASLPAYIYVLFGTASRGITVGTVAGLLTLAAGQVTSARRALQVGGFVVLVGVTAIVVAPKSYRERMTNTVEFDETTGQAVKVNDSERRNLAASSFSFIAEKPLLGGGSMGSGLSRKRAGHLGTTTHSTYLGITDSYGIPVLLLLLFTMGRAALALVRAVRFGEPTVRLYASAWLAGYTGLAVYSIASSTMIDRNMWLMIALACTLEGRFLSLTAPRSTPQASVTPRPLRA